MVLSHPAIADRSSIAVSTSIAILIAFLWLLAHERSGAVLAGPASCLAALWLLALFGSAALHGTWQLSALLTPLLSVGLLWVGARLGRERSAARAVLMSLVAASVIAAVHAALQHAGLDPLPRFDEFPRRVVGPFTNPNHLGSLAALALPVALSGFLALCSRRPSFPWVAGSGGGAAVLAVYASLLLAGSRGAIWAAIVGAVAVTCLAGHALLRRSRRPAWIPLILLLLSLAGITRLLQERPIMEGPDGEVSVGQRLRAMSNMTGKAAQSDLTVLHRRVLWRAAWDIFAENPMLGVGPGGYQRACEALLTRMTEDPRVALLSRLNRLDVPRYAHNEWLHSLAEVGLGGTIPWTMLLALTLATSVVREWKGSDGIHQAEAGACCAVLTHSLVSYPMYLPATAGCFWLLLGMLTASRKSAAQYLS